eukprot:TRINITY_DN11283_c0_g1_i1.p1 TRINITY_DN11283_c0_g1~~TRINITY_DN11283_c0_g1_i1.p1  ORF type:complete len:833 (+),score=275.17 TRINITY_DN11283_c0_g1_i1:84-2501(+)
MRAAAAALLALAPWAGALPLGEWQIVPVGNPGTRLRHCLFSLYSTAPSLGLQDDFAWKVVPALNGKGDSVSFQSVNYATRYIVPINGSDVEAGRLGIRPVTDKDMASWRVIPAQDGSYSFQSSGGGYLALDGRLQGDCAGQYTKGRDQDVTLVKQPDAALSTFRLVNNADGAVTVDAGNATHEVNPLYMGCHSDTGYTHQGRGFSSQLLFGESFEAAPGEPATWQQTLIPATAKASVAVDAAVGGGLHGQQALRINYTAGSGTVGMGNRGIGNEGLFLQAGKEYEGYFFVKSAQKASVVVSLLNYRSNATLASQQLSFPGGDWTRLSFTLTPSADAPCSGITPGSDPAVQCGGQGKGVAGHICVRCEGQFVVGLAAPAAAEVLFDFVWLQPGPWGRLNGLPVLKGTIDTLKSIGTSAIRQGGSFTAPQYYFWKNWRGRPWERPSVGATWGQELISSWGPFEMADMCEAAGFEPIITTTADNKDCCAPDDMADLIEYCWGNQSTKWGATRVADGHPEPYRVRYFELGNEQYNSKYVEQVRAMEKRASELGKGGEMYYIFPNNGKYLTDQDGEDAEMLGLKDHLLSDLHVGAGGAVGGSQKLFAKKPKWTEGSINLETNAATHHMDRALAEGQDLIEWFSTFIPSTSRDRTSRIKARTASFCTERSGHFDAFDQGITFFLPNMSWIQPPGYVHKMIHDTWLPLSVPVNLSGGSALAAGAQRSADGTSLRLLVTNQAESVSNLHISIKGMNPAPGVTITTLTAPSLDSANPPGQPTLISPQTTKAPWTNGGNISVPSLSFNVIQISRQ